MEIFIICSKSFYDDIPVIKEELETAGHKVILPNCFDDPGTELRMKSLGEKDHSKWKGEMLRHSAKVIQGVDAVLVLNGEKNGIPNYIGGATFAEIYEAFRQDKIIYCFNPLPEGLIISDELAGLGIIVLNEDLSLIKQPDELIR